MIEFYASLIGPLRGCYYPLPPELETEAQRRAALNSSRLLPLWHSIYPKAEVERQIREFGGCYLPESFARRLDYDSFAVKQAGK